MGKSFDLRGLWTPIKERSWGGFAEGLGVGLLVLIILLLALVGGFLLSVVNFTYGARGHIPEERALILIIIGRWVIGSYVFEAIVRGGLLRSFLVRYPWKKALSLHGIILFLCLLPYFLKVGTRMEEMGLLRFMMYEILLQALWTLFFLRTGSVAATGIVHGLHNSLRFALINDISGPMDTLYFFSAASEHFYGLQIAVILVAMAGVSLLCGRWGMREAAL